MKYCEIGNKCGGCTYWNTEYEKQLQEKEKQIKDIFKEYKIQPIIKMDNPYNYRNKGKYVFGYDKKNNPEMGFFEEGTHKIVHTSNCMIQNKQINEIAEYVFKLIKQYKIRVYNEDTKKGFMRHLIIRYGAFTNEVMVILVTVDGKIHKREEIINKLITKFPNIKTVVQNINEKETSAILGNKVIKLYGNGFIVDYLNGVKFKISPLSFYQVNPIQTEKLYAKAIEYADIKNKETVYDLYSGIGTISLSASKNAYNVYGIEIVKDAVKDAIENAQFNHIKNAHFIAGRVENILPQLYKKTGKVDIVIVDPPRSGLDKKTIETIKGVKPKKVVYVSCNPLTLSDNLSELSDIYNVKEIQPVDMFPWTKHVECVVGLQLM